MNKRKLKFLYNWAAQICDPLKAMRGLTGLRWYFKDFVQYKKMPDAEQIRFLDSHPQLHDRNRSHELDAHYFYVNAWAVRRIVANKPLQHLDVASQTIFSSFLSALFPVTYLDYRPLEVALSDLKHVEGDILNLPFKDDSIESLSCLHVAEHIGLGRYGDPLDPNGTKKSSLELKRILARGGNLFFAVPVGKPRVCFNAHRIHAAESILAYFKGLELVEFSGVHDDGKFVERVNPAEFANSDYALGMFWFKK